MILIVTFRGYAMRDKTKGEKGAHDLWDEIEEFFEKELVYIQNTAKIRLWSESLGAGREEGFIDELAGAYLNEDDVSQELTQHKELAVIFKTIEVIIQENEKKQNTHTVLDKEALRKEIKANIKDLLKDDSQHALQLIALVVKKRIDKREENFSNLMMVQPELTKLAEFEDKSLLITPIQNYPKYKIQLLDIVKHTEDPLRANMAELLAEVDAFLINCEKITQVPAKLKTIQQKLACLPLVLWDSEAFYSAFKSDLKHALHELNTSNSSDFCKVPGIEPPVKELLELLDAIQMNKGDLKDVKSACAVAMNSIVAHSDTPIRKGSPQDMMVQVINGHYLKLTSFLARKEFLLGPLFPIEKYFTTPGHVFSDFEGKKRAYSDLLNQINAILIEKNSKPSEKIAQIKKSIEALEGQYSFAGLGYVVGIFVPQLKKLRNSLKNENDLEGLEVAVTLMLNGELAASQTPVLASNSSSEGKEKEKEDHTKSADPYYYENRVLQQFLTPHNPFFSEEELSNALTTSLFAKLQDVQLSIMRGDPIKVTADLPQSNLEFVYNRDGRSFLRDDLVRAYMSLSSSNPAQKEFKMALEALHKICFHGEPLFMLDDFNTYLKNLDTHHLPSKKVLLNDLSYFFKRAGCGEYNTQYYLSQLHKTTVEQTGKVNGLFDVISMHLYNKKCSVYLSELEEARIAVQHRAPKVIIEEQKPVPLTLNQIKNKLLTHQYRLEELSDTPHLRNGVVEFKCFPIGVVMRVNGLEQRMQMLTVRWDELPADFPHEDSLILQDKERWLLELLKIASAKHLIAPMYPDEHLVKGKIFAGINDIEKRYPLLGSDKSLQQVQYLEIYKLFAQIAEEESSARNLVKSPGFGGWKLFQKNVPQGNPLLEWGQLIFKDVLPKNPGRMTSVTELLDAIPEKYKPADKRINTFKTSTKGP